MERKDYYKILGVSKDATEGDIKKAFKKLAVKWHPDKQVGKSEQDRKDAEEKFKDINEAYSVLSDPTKKQQYDNPTPDFGGFDFSNFDPFSAFKGFGGFDGFDDFGGFNPFGQRGPQIVKGQNIRINIGVTLEDILNGVTKTIKYNRKKPCSACGGSGKTSKTKEEMCPHCGGTGKLFQQHGPMQMMTTCGHCGGTGKLIKDPCSACGGSGLEVESNQIEINIPKGAFEGSQYIMEGQGSAPPKGEGIYGDLLIVVKEIPHDEYKRDGLNLIKQIDIPVLDGILGCTVEVNTLDGKTLSTKIRQGIGDGDMIRFKGKGLPHPQNGQMGDMIGVINFIMPQKLNDEEIRLLNELKEQEHFKKN